MSAALATRLERIRDLGGIKGRDIAQLMGTTPETVSRWNTGRIEPQPGRLEKLLMLEWIIDELSEFFLPDEARLWRFSPNRMLGGSRPADHIKDGRIDEVRALIAHLRDGAYV
jgi:transcriptional regulator with XRE-family HTH domain